MATLHLPTSLVACAEAVAAGAVSPVELVAAALVRAEQAPAGAFSAIDAGAARERAQILAEELRMRGPRGPLHGVPVAVGHGIEIAPGAERDAGVVAMLRRAGAIILGRTHDGSGPSLAVASGACAIAVGADTAGALRIPAALHGMSALGARPSALPTSPNMDDLGIAAATPCDLALAWAALHGIDPVGDPGELRVGVPSPEALGPVDAEVAALVHEAIAALDAAEVGEPELPAFDTDDARHRLGELHAALRLAVGAFDVLAWPTTPRGAAGEGEGQDAGGDLSRLCAPVSVAGLAAVTVPCGVTPAGSPAGVQVVGRGESVVLAAARRLDELAKGLRERTTLDGRTVRNERRDQCPTAL